MIDFRHLITFLESQFAEFHVYRVAPRSDKISYPCIVISEAPPNIRSADNSVYIFDRRFECVMMSTSHLSDVIEKLAKTDGVRINRIYFSGGLHHIAFTI